MANDITFRFAGETLTVRSEGPMWVSPSTGQQHAELADAVRAECVRCAKDSGDDPTDCETEIQAAIDSVCV